MKKIKNDRKTGNKHLINLQNKIANNHVGANCVRPQTHRGITLIALIITIIVMLILVAVTINVALDTGLFGIAKEAGNKTKVEADREILQGAVVGSVNEDLQIPNATTLQQNLPEGWNVTGVDGGPYTVISPNGNIFTVDNKGNITVEGEEIGTADVHNWERNLDDITCTKCGAHYTIGEEINYTPNAQSEATIEGEKSGLKDARAINYVTRDVTTGPFSAVEVNVAEKYPSDIQTINKEELEWVVLGIDDTDNNGTNETLLITSKTVTQEGVFGYGTEAIRHMPDELDRICEELYSNSVYGNARSMCSEDIENCLGHIETSSRIMYKAEEIIVDNITTKYKDLNNVRDGLWDEIKTGLPNDENVTPEIIGEYTLPKRMSAIQKQGNEILWGYLFDMNSVITKHSVTDNVLNVLYDNRR